MATAMEFDEAKARVVETIYATPDVAATRIAAFQVLNPHPADRLLDVGCGPGYVSRELGLAVGERGRVAGIDLSAPMLALARKRCAELSWVEFVEGDVCELPFSNEEFDGAVALQVYAYPPDLPTALAELGRVLRPGGRAVILDTDFDTVVWQSRDRARMQRILDAYRPHVSHPDLPRILTPIARNAGLSVARCQTLPIVTTSYQPNSYVYGLAHFIRDYATQAPGVSEGDTDAWLAEFDELERDGAFFFSLNRYLFDLRKPGPG